MNVAVIGSGGREHALCESLKRSKKVDKIFCMPGNAGTGLIAENVDIRVDEFEKIKNFAIENEVNIVVVGPEKPLVDGIVEYLEKFNIKVFGPNKLASQLEGSKIFTKKLCEKQKIPTAKFGIFHNKKDSEKFFCNCIYPIVVKADGLAAGKGVYICEDKNQATIAVNEIFDGKFGKAHEVLVEEFLKGEEMSFFIISDGQNFKTFGTAQDHKRVYEGDKGKNTGGMGAYSPSRLESDQLNKKISDKIIIPTIKGLQEMKIKFVGFLYAGLMIVNNEPFLIEYNVRMGDPECQTILPKLKTELIDIIIACINKKLEAVKIEWDDKKSLCIVLCSKGYPEEYINNVEIIDLEKISIQKNEFIFHAGTKNKNSKIYSNGGRVLNFTVVSENFKESRDKAMSLVNRLNWSNGYYRRDIGYKVIDQ
jgi:phosphoribosylamine--glycine ligase